MEKPEIIIDSWMGCYSDGWQGDLNPDAFAHPAKYSRGLIRKIYQHATEEGWLQAGDTVIDPFGGISAGSVDAMLKGINWIGNELEPRFVDLGGGEYVCPGFQKWFWKRFYLRVGRLNYKAFHLCPDCAKAMNAGESRVIPARESHIYKGNIALWDDKYRAWWGEKLGKAVLLKGDSRELLNNLRGAITGQAGAAVSSPPYSGTHIADITTGRIGDNPEQKVWRQTEGDNYNRSNHGNLGNLSATDTGYQAAISSPPYAEARIDGNGDEGSSGLRSENGEYLRGSEGWRKRKEMGARYGAEGSNLGNLKASDNGFAAAVSSPPYSESMNREGGIDPAKSEHIGGPHSQMNRSDTRYGSSDGQLGAMKPGDLDAAISSPPYTGAQQVDNRENPSSAM